MKATVHNPAETNQLSDNVRLIINYSLLVAVTFTLIFAIANLLNLETVEEIRFLNYLLMFPITFVALKKSYNLHGKKMEYFSGFTTALLICVLGQLLYSILFFIYLHLDRNFTAYILSQFPRKVINPELSIAFVLFSEGAAIGAVVALAMMQYFKKKRGRWNAQS